MTHKERMLATLRGEPTDAIPWAPRLDLWYNSRKRAGTLPPKYRNAALYEITDDLGWGLHAIVPDFKTCATRATTCTARSAFTISGRCPTQRSSRTLTSP